MTDYVVLEVETLARYARLALHDADVRRERKRLEVKADIEASHKGCLWWKRGYTPEEVSEILNSYDLETGAAWLWCREGARTIDLCEDLFKLCKWARSNGGDGKVWVSRETASLLTRT